MKYDDASWHYGGDFPKDLPIEAGATHTGMFVTWAFLSGLAGELHSDELPEILSCWGTRTNTPGNLFLELCDGKFTDEDLDDEGNAFAREYFDFETGQYIHDYESLLAVGLPSIYHIPDTWENYDLLTPVLHKRLVEWRAKNG